jgi:LPS O-antigen subunit length determinant protein (WzzB/FepE family)
MSQVPSTGGGETVRQGPPADDDIDLRAVAGTLWSKRFWIIASAIVFSIPFVAAAVLMTPVYRATTVLADARDNPSSAGTLSNALNQLGGLAALARINVGSATQVDEALAVMRSREFTERFIQEQNMLPELFPDLWDKDARDWRVPVDQRPTLTQGYALFDSIRSTSFPTGRGGLITVSIEWTDREIAARWVNALIARLNSEMRARAIASTKLSQSFLEKELDATSTIETRQAINRLMEAQINQRMLANVTQEYAFRTVDKALPPEPDDIVRPNKLVLVALGPTVGLIFGVFAVLVINVFAARRASATRH